MKRYLTTLAICFGLLMGYEAMAVEPTCTNGVDGSGKWCKIPECEQKSPFLTGPKVNGICRLSPQGSCLALHIGCFNMGSLAEECSVTDNLVNCAGLVIDHTLNPTT